MVSTLATITIVQKRRAVLIFLLFFIFGLKSKIIAQYPTMIDSLNKVAALNIQRGISPAAPYNQLSVAWRRKDPSVSLGYAFKALSAARAAKDDTSEVDAFVNIGSAYNQLGNYEKTLNTAYEALGIAQRHKDALGQGAVYSLIASCYAHLQIWPDSARKYCEKSLKIFLRYGTERDIARAYNNYGYFYVLSQKPDSALIYYQKVKAIGEKIQYKDVLYPAFWNNLGEVYMQKQDFTSALHYFHKSLTLKKQLQLNSSLPNTFRKLSQVHLMLNKTDSAILYADMSKRTSESYRLIPEIRDSYRLLSEAYSAKGDYRLAYECLNKYQKYADSSLNERAITAIAQTQIQAKIDSQIKENRHLKELNSIAESKIRLQYSLIAVGIIALLITLSLALFAYRQYKQKMRLNAELEQRVAERTAELQRKNARLEQYADTNSHGLRAAVASILGLADILLSYSLSEQERVRYLEMLNRAAHTLDNTVRNINHLIHKAKEEE